MVQRQYVGSFTPVPDEIPFICSMKFSSFFTIMLLLLWTPSLATDIQSEKQPEELGKVDWGRDYEQALSRAKAENKAVLILFQEVPGCGTCRNYGRQVLSHPLMVEAIENEFIPLAIHNNAGGEDARILKLYGEPSWNNPVVRIVSAKGKNLVPRVAGNYSSAGLMKAMLAALSREGKEVPGYVQLLSEEINAKGKLGETYFQMYCFWSGEGHLGSAPGVVATEPGFMAGREVVKVQFNLEETSTEQLKNYASKASCQPIEGKAFRTDKDPQYYLKHTPYRFLPLTTLQKTRINSALSNKANPIHLLSPQQKKWLDKVWSKGGVSGRYTEDFEVAWAEMSN